jgi:uncharacterized protein
MSSGVAARMVAGLPLALVSAQAAAQMAVDSAAATGPAWSPYIVGAGIGLLVVCTFYFSGKPVGASGAYAKAAGQISKRVAPEHTENLPYFKEETTTLDWEFFFVCSAIAGGFLAAATGGELTGRFVPPLWELRFGPETWLRVLVAFFGGAVMAYGARLAGGCTSGHGISGTLQLSVGSWIAVICFFVGGVMMAHLMFRL